ncbi:Uncharacterised protein [Cedecea neteri]|uniref:Uncharacterized protein n=1 Tax=Cedecea neteri TaxID=158822 RepID=A0A2X2T4E8_9ENTR|nr:Uncharacterised protein [Cedecea neteri]
MLLSDGRYVMAFCSTNLFWITRRAPFGVAKLLDQDVEIDFQEETNTERCGHGHCDSAADRQRNLAQN